MAHARQFLDWHASDRRRNVCDDRDESCGRGGLPHQIHQSSGAFCGCRRDRCGRPRGLRPCLPRNRPDHRYRQSARRGRHYCSRAGGERTAGRLHRDHGRPFGLATGQCHSLSQPEISSGPQSDADRHFRQHGCCPAGEQRAAGEDCAGAGGAGQEQARRTDLCFDRRRHAGSPQRRTVQPPCRHQGRARALSRRRTGGDRFVAGRVSFWIAPIPTMLQNVRQGQLAAPRRRRRSALKRLARHSDRQGDRHR